MVRENIPNTRVESYFEYIVYYACFVRIIITMVLVMFETSLKRGYEILIARIRFTKIHHNSKAKYLTGPSLALIVHCQTDNLKFKTCLCDISGK